MPHIIEEINCRTFDEFLEKLRPSNDIWDEEAWVFRGHANDSYELLPTLFRSGGRGILIESYHKQFEYLLQYGLPREQGIPNQSVRNSHPNGFEALTYCNIERSLIYEFAKTANDAGLPIPDLLNILQELGEVVPHVGLAMPAFGKNDHGVDRITGMDPPFFKPNEAVSLAQHHGVPTRLLDFTTDPMRGLYFATTFGEADVICVWAVKLKLLKKALIDGFKRNLRYRSAADLYSEYGVLEVSTANNEYLKNQKGLFLYPKFPYEFYAQNGRFPSLLDFVESFYGDRDENSPNRPLRKITLPRNQVPELRARIGKEQISLTKLMPSFDNVKIDMVANFQNPFQRYKYWWQRFDVGSSDTLIQGYSSTDEFDEGNLTEFCKFKKKFCPVDNGYRLYIGYSNPLLNGDPDMNLSEPGTEITRHVKAAYSFNRNAGFSELVIYQPIGNLEILKTIPI